MPLNASFKQVGPGPTNKPDVEELPICTNPVGAGQPNICDMTLCRVMSLQSKCSQRMAEHSSVHR